MARCEKVSLAFALRVMFTSCLQVCCKQYLFPVLRFVPSCQLLLYCQRASKAVDSPIKTTTLLTNSTILSLNSKCCCIGCFALTDGAGATAATIDTITTLPAAEQICHSLYYSTPISSIVIDAAYDCDRTVDA